MLAATVTMNLSRSTRVNEDYEARIRDVTFFGGKLGVGKSVAVSVGVNNSAPRAVTVGVKVSGVGVDVAKRFWAGLGVTVADGAGVSVAGTGVGVLSNPLISDNAEQPERNMDNKMRCTFFFMK